MSISDSLSTRPYLIRAIFEWCVDQGLTPYLVVMVDERVKAPKEFIKNGEIVLNIGPDATGGLQLGNDWIEFKARFGGVARDILCLWTVWPRSMQERTVKACHFQKHPLLKLLA